MSNDEILTIMDSASYLKIAKKWPINMFLEA